MTKVPFTYTWIERPKIIIGSIPAHIEDVVNLRTEGVEAVLTLTRRDPQTYVGMNPWSFWKVLHRHVPIPDGGVADDSAMLDAAQFVHDMVRQKKPIFVHCRGGIGRSGTIVIAYYVIYRNMTLDQARDMVRVRRNYEGNACAADQGSPQREWIDALPGRIEKGDIF